MSKRFMLALMLLLGIGFCHVSFAGISDTPHDVVKWYGYDTFEVAGAKTGLCSYCHIPHSSKGDRLFPMNVDSASLGLNKGGLGEVAFLCAQCHSNALDADFTSAHLDDNDEVLFKPLMKPTRTADTTVYDTHPTIYTANYLTVSTLGIADSTTTQVTSQTWPYYSDWAAARRDIECTSCHNPHDWNQETRRNYLRSSWWDTAANVNAPTGETTNVCSFCHTGRDTEGVGTANQGSHPVNNTVGVWQGPAGNETAIVMRADYAGIWLQGTNGGFGGGTSHQTSAFFATLNDTTGATSSKEGRAVGDRGAHLGPKGEFTCMSCHMPHGAPPSQDGVVQLAYSLQID